MEKSLFQALQKHTTTKAGIEYFTVRQVSKITVLTLCQITDVDDLPAYKKSELRCSRCGS